MGVLTGICALFLGACAFGDARHGGFIKRGPLYVFFIFLAAWSLGYSDRTAAETLVTPYASLGIGHRNCSTTDRLICDNPEMGSDTPGFIEAGLRFEPDRPRWYLLMADEIDIGWRHQSYVDRGWPGSGEEAQIDSYAVLLTWKLKALSFRLPL